MYGLSADVVRPGAALPDIISHRYKTGSMDQDPHEYCARLTQNIAAGEVVSFINETPDGRAISVVNRAIPGGAYWVRHP